MFGCSWYFFCIKYVFIITLKTEKRYMSCITHSLECIIFDFSFKKTSELCLLDQRGSKMLTFISLYCLLCYTCVSSTHMFVYLFTRSICLCAVNKFTSWQRDRHQSVFYSLMETMTSCLFILSSQSMFTWLKLGLGCHPSGLMVCFTHIW